MLLRKLQYSLLSEYEVTELLATHGLQQKGGDYLFEDSPEQWNVVKITKSFCSEIKKEVLREKKTKKNYSVQLRKKKTFPMRKSGHYCV